MLIDEGAVAELDDRFRRHVVQSMLRYAFPALQERSGCFRPSEHDAV